MEEQKINDDITRIATGTIEDGKLQCVFGLLYCRNAKPYKLYDDVQNLQDIVFPMTLMQMRWNGQLGFPGGKADHEGEDLTLSLRRELKEEINLDIDTISSNIEPLATFRYKEKANIHSFAIEVDFDDLNKIKENSINAKHYIAENLGCIFCPITNKRCGEFNNFLQHNFIATAKVELETLAKEKNLLS